jgi:hypothetical protein
LPAQFLACWVTQTAFPEMHAQAAQLNEEPHEKGQRLRRRDLDPDRPAVGA